MSVKCKHYRDSVIKCVNNDIGIVVCPFDDTRYARECCKGYEPEEDPLKACPFCGYELIHTNEYKIIDGQSWFKCWCGSCEVETPGYKSRELANRAWNTRVQR